MVQRRHFTLISVLLLAVVLASCAAPQAPATQAPTAAPAAAQPTAAPSTEVQPTAAPPTSAPQQIAAQPTAAPSASGPKDLRIAVITCCDLESQWDAQFLKAMDRVKAAKPHGLNITYQVTDNTYGDDATPVIQNYAQSGKYDIVWTTSTYSDQVEKVMDKFPNVMFVVQGSGNRGLGKNQYWTYMRVHEPAYLLGMLAGKMTKTNRVGAVGTFEADDVNDEINAFFQGAKDVNPQVKATVSFIQSWYDPVKGAEATNAQAAAGVDYVLQLADGWQACTDKNIMCFGNFGDQNSLAPKNVPNSTVAGWDTFHQLGPRPVVGARGRGPALQWQRHADLVQYAAGRVSAGAMAWFRRPDTQGRAGHDLVQAGRHHERQVHGAAQRQHAKVRQLEREYGRERMETTSILRVEALTKQFGQVVANDAISMDVRKGEIHCLLGENGAGKSTLAECLYGFYKPDAGQIYIRGKPVKLTSPSDAMHLGIGMVHQHFALVPPLTVIENVIVGAPRAPVLPDLRQTEETLQKICREYGIQLDLHRGSGNSRSASSNGSRSSKPSIWARNC